MSTKESSGYESVDEKRSRYEQFEFGVCPDGQHVNVKNATYGESGHVYTVSVSNGDATRCTCPHHEHRGVQCKHIHAVESNQIVLQAVLQAAQDVAIPDGGQDMDSCQNGQTGCCGPQGDDLPCWECYRQ